MSAIRGLHIHIEKEVSNAVDTLKNSDLVLHLKDRSAHYIVHELIKGNEIFKLAQQQAASERHPRPGKR